MALTVAQQKLVDELHNEWWRIESVIDDVQQRSDFVWDVAREQVDLTTYFCSTLSNYVEPARVNEAIDFVIAVMETFDTQQHRGSALWDHSVEGLLQRASEHDPNQLHRRLDELPDVAEDFSRMFLVDVDETAYGPLTERALRRLARAWAATNWEEPWYEARADLRDDEWHALVLEALETHRHGLVDWPKVRDFVQQATVEQKLAILQQDFSPSIRAHVHAMLADATLDELRALEAGFTRFDQQHDYYAWHRKGALSIAMHVHGAALGWEPTEDAREALIVDLASYVTVDHDVTAAALQTLPPDEREAILLAAIERSHHGASRVFALAWVCPTDEVLDHIIDHLEQLDDPVPMFIDGLVAIGAPLVDRMCELLGTKASLPTVKSCIEALGRIGDPRAAPLLVEQLGGRSTETREAAQVALERLGDAALDALREGVEHKKVRVREACSALLTAHALAQSSPLTELAARYEDVRPDDLEAKLAEIVVDQQTDYRSADVTRFAERYGIFVMLRVRDWFLESPGDLYRRDVWRNAVEYFRKDPDIAWIAVDGFAHLPEQTSWELEQHVDILRRIADRDPVKTCAAIAHQLRGRPPLHRAELLRLLIETAEAPPADVFLRAMRDDSKVVRELGVEGIQRAGAEYVDEVVALASASRKQIRLAAANALAELAAEPVLERLQAAYESEKTADVRTALERAIRNAGGAAVAVPEDDDEDAFQAFLAGLARTNLPAFAKPSRLPALRFDGSGTALGGPATRGFVARLMKEGPEHTDPVARAICERLDRESVHAFGAALLTAWENDGADPGEKWAVYQTAVTAGPRQLDTIGPALDALASDGNHHRAVWFLDALRRHPEPAAQAWILHWARWAERSSVKAAAQAHIEAAATEARVSRVAYESTLNAYIANDVAERTMPTLGLEEPLVIDYGVRRFQVRLGTNHRLTIVETTSARVVDRLPTPRKAESADDAQLERYRDVRQQLRAVVRDAGDRLEREMGTGRPWTRSAFEAFFGAHPIAREFAHRLVFVTDDGVLFRRSEGDDLGAEWDAVGVCDDALIRVAHPLDMSDEERERWSEHLADAEIIQPFEQVGRPVYLLADHALQIDDYPVLTNGTFVRERRRLGWIRAMSTEHDGMIHQAIRPFPGLGQRALLQHYAYHPSDLQWNPDEEMRLEKLWFEDLAGNELALKDIDPRAYSEVRYDLSRWFT